MPKVIIADTSTFILFQKIGELDLLKKVYGSLVTTPEIELEFGQKLPDWVAVESVKDKKYQSFLETQLDLGEASAIALASEFSDVLLLLDDLKARKLATQLNFKVTGTLGILHKAKQMSIVEKVKPLVDKLIMNDFRIAKPIIKELLRMNGE